MQIAFSFGTVCKKKKKRKENGKTPRRRWQLFPRYKPRSNSHPAYSLGDLRCAAATSLLFEELLSHVQLCPGILFVRCDGLWEAVREVGPPLSKMASNGDGIDNIPVFRCIQQRTATRQCIVDFFRGAGLVVVKC